MSSRRNVKTVSGAGLLNSVINSLPVELHLPGYQFCGPGTDLRRRLSENQQGVNVLDSFCKDHDIAYSKSDLPSDRAKADLELENRAWSRVGSSDADFKEKAASWVVTTAMKAKRRLGAGCGFKNIVGVAKKAIKCSVKACRRHSAGAPNLTKLIGLAVSAAKKHAFKRKINKPRVIRIPKTGGTLSLIPIFAGLSALGALVGGAGSIVKAIRDVNSASHTGSPVHLGKGLYLHPYKGGSYRMIKTTGAAVSKRGARKQQGAVARRENNNNNNKMNKKKKTKKAAAAVRGKTRKSKTGNRCGVAAGTKN